MKRITTLVVLISFIATIMGCATIISGRNQSLPVITIPSGAIVTINGMKQVSPATFILDRRMESYTIRVEKEGYESLEITLKKGLNGWVFGNILWGLLGGVIGVVIDTSTGAINKFTPTEVEVNLVQQQVGMEQLKNKDILMVKLVGQ